MHALFWVLAACGVMISVGLFTRLASLAFAMLFTYVFLLEQAAYLNHFYLICILAYLLAIVPANAAWSLDAWLFPRIVSATVPNWGLWAIRGHLHLLFYGGLAKLTATGCKGTDADLAGRNRITVSVVAEPWTPYLFAYGGLLFDLLIVPALLWRKTRWPALAAMAFFHVSNARLFPIGIFPWLMLGATTIFLPPDWPRKWLAWLGGKMADTVECATPRPTDHPSLATTLILAILLIHFSVQLVVPFRHYLYPDDASWTEEGHLCAWRMKLRDKRGWVQFLITEVVAQ
jgi:hypothetical protein